ncbi:MAG: hypothetical protein ABIJ96_12765 [Elusimicrobiota bacterium]
MRAYIPGVLAVLLAALPAAAAGVRVKAGGGAGVSGGAAGAAPAGIGSAELTNSALKAPTLIPALKTPVSVPRVDGKINAGKARLVQPEVEALDLPQPFAAQAAVDPVLAEAISGGQAAEPAEDTPAESGAEAAPAAELQAAMAQALFDGAKTHLSLWDSFKGIFRSPDNIPAYPAGEGKSVRIGGRSYSLGRKLSATDGSVLYMTRTNGDNAVRIIRQGSPAAEAFKEELAARAEMRQAGLPHTEVLAVSADGLAFVERYYDRARLDRILADNNLTPDKVQGLAHLAALLLRQGHTADLRPGNLVWDHWHGRWLLGRAAGYQPASGAAVLGQLFGAGVADRPGFLSALRGRLGPSSKAWRAAVRDGLADRRLRPAFTELARRDEKYGSGPRLSFTAEAAPGKLDDSLLTRRQAAKRLGYDPRTAAPRQKLHGDDPGKLNTEVAMLFPGTPEASVYKGAEVRIIRNELFMRKIVHRYFARYFKAPWSLAYLDGYESAMVMEASPGSAQWSKAPLSPEQRVALAVMVRTFGVSDVNPGNLLYDQGEVTLIDFEQALSRAPPVAYRLPIESILEEMPWVRADEPMEIETFFAGIKDWREHFHRTETQAEIRQLLIDSGFTNEEAGAALGRFVLNAADLEWALQTDVDFAKHFIKKKTPS